MAKDYQSAYIMALKFVLPEGELRELVKKNFAANIRKNGLQTGFFATEHLLPLLVEAGETELAYDILLQEGCPGWMYQIKCGATTTWERWDALKTGWNGQRREMAGSRRQYGFFQSLCIWQCRRILLSVYSRNQTTETGFCRIAFRAVSGQTAWRCERKLSLKSKKN